MSDGAGTVPRATLAPGTVHFWLATHTPAPLADSAIQTLLSPDERARERRFLRPEDRRRFAVGRALLRTVVGRHLHVAPASLEFTTSATGRPELSYPAAPHLHFNLSHSGAWVLLGATIDALVGVDVEAMRHLDDRDALAERCFAPRELADLARMEEAARHDAFFRCWTRKEAYLKALGLGITGGLDSFAVTIRHDEPLAIFQETGEPFIDWTLANLVVDEETRGAIAVGRAGTKLEGWRWHGGTWSDAA